MFVLVVGIGLSSAVGLCFMVEICEVGRSWSGEWICGGWGKARNSGGREGTG